MKFVLFLLLVLFFGSALALQDATHQGVLKKTVGLYALLRIFLVKCMKKIFSMVSFVISLVSCFRTSSPQTQAQSAIENGIPKNSLQQHEREMTLSDLDWYIGLGLEFFVHFRWLFGEGNVVEEEPFTLETMLACINRCGVHHLPITGQDFFRFTELLSKFTQELPFSLERDSFRYFHLASFGISEGQFQVFLRLADYFLLTKPNLYWLICLGVIVLQNSKNDPLIQMFLRITEEITEHSQIMKLSSYKLEIFHQTELYFQNPIIEGLLEAILTLYTNVKTLKQLTLDHVRLKRNHLQVINKIFLSNPNITELFLCSNSIGSNFQLIQLKHLCHLERITIRNNCIRYNGYLLFMFSWAKYFTSSLKYFDISMNAISDDVLQPHNFTLRGKNERIKFFASKMEAICLGRNSFSNSSVKDFAIFKNIKSLEFSLDYASSTDGSDSFFIYEFLRNFSQLESLSFSASGIEVEEFALLVKFLSSLVQFKSLSISNVALSINHVISITDYFSHSLEHLKLTYCKITNDEFSEIITKLKRLKTLNLSGNDITRIHFPHPTSLLEHLNLARNPLTKNDWVLFYRFLPRLKYLKEIRHNYSSENDDDILYELLHALPQCHELEKVEFMNLMFNTANQLKLIEMIENGILWLKTLAICGCSFDRENFGKLLAVIDRHPERISHLITTIPRDDYQEYVKKIPIKSGMLLFH